MQTKNTQTHTITSNADVTSQLIDHSITTKSLFQYRFTKCFCTDEWINKSRLLSREKVWTEISIESLRNEWMSSSFVERHQKNKEKQKKSNCQMANACHSLVFGVERARYFYLSHKHNNQSSCLYWTRSYWGNIFFFIES